jgi:hypothetical protein
MHSGSLQRVRRRLKFVVTNGTQSSQREDAELTEHVTGLDAAPQGGDFETRRLGLLCRLTASSVIGMLRVLRGLRAFVKRVR